MAAACEQADAGKLVLGGAFGDPVEGGYLIWKDTTVEAVEDFVKKDPYFTSGLVKSYTIKPFNVTVRASQD